MEKISTEEVIDKLDMFQSRFGNIDEFGWWDLEKNYSRCRIAIYPDGVQRRMPNLRSSLKLKAPEHQEMNRQDEVTWITLCIISQTLMVHARISEEYIDFALMYTTENIFPVLPIKNMINK